MLRLLLSLPLLQVALAFGHYPDPLKVCKPTHHYIPATITNIAVDLQYVKEFSTEVQYEDLLVTMPYVSQALQLQTVDVTVFPEPYTLVETSYVTDIAYQIDVNTVLATAVVTDTLQVLVTEVVVEERTITQTKVQEQVVRDTLTHLSHKTLYRTRLVTETEFVFVTRTTRVPHVITLTTQKVVGYPETQVVTNFQDQLVDVTVTVTDNLTVTSCYAPSISYSR